MNSKDVRKKFIEFYTTRGHTEIPSAPIVPVNDPTTLFTSSGMQPLIPYLLGQKHPAGKRLVDSQKSFRAQDIEEVGDNRHTTFFEMLGNWSLGDYFKKEQLPWIWEFLTKELGLDQKRLYVSVFSGEAGVPRDEESAAIWKSLGVPEDRIFYYGVNKNWWSRSGEPDAMPQGEPGGPDSEVFFDFERPIHDGCHPNCDCGRYMEIANSVFMQYQKQKDGTLKELPQKNVDFGGGLERMTAAVNNDPDVFQTDVFLPLMRAVEDVTPKNDTRAMRIIADHMKAAVFMLSEGVLPGNKQQGYVLRRLIRRAVVKMHQLGITPKKVLGEKLYGAVRNIYEGVYTFPPSPDALVEEISRFENVLKRGMSEFEKHEIITGTVAFDLLQSYGFPWELTYEMAKDKGQDVDKEAFQKEFKKHQELSRTAAAGMFKGGLADQSEATTKLHTAHHLLLAALQKGIDPAIKQRGSNITAERLRIDVSFPRKFTVDELKKVEAFVNEKIKENLTVTREEMEKTDAEKIGAQMEFGAKYPDRVSVYFVGDKANFFSAEFCGGPHAAFTGDLGHFTITKEDASGAGIRRLYATLTKHAS